MHGSGAPGGALVAAYILPTFNAFAELFGISRGGCWWLHFLLYVLFWFLWLVAAAASPRALRAGAAGFGVVLLRALRAAAAGLGAALLQALFPGDPLCRDLRGPFVDFLLDFFVDFSYTYVAFFLDELFGVGLGRDEDGGQWGPDMDRRPGDVRGLCHGVPVVHAEPQGKREALSSFSGVAEVARSCKVCCKAPGSPGV